jgi:hypothetical protein
MASVSNILLNRITKNPPADFHQPALTASSRLELHLAAEAETQNQNLNRII